MQYLLRNSKYLLVLLLGFTLIVFLNKSSIERVPQQQSIKAAQNHFDSDFWSNMGHELTLDHKVETKQVQTEINRFLADRGKLYSILQAAAPYIYFIHSETQNRKLPAEIALIPAIESEFNPYDHSNKGATGLWQLMPQTAHDLGIKSKPNYDGRRDVVASTKAALAYFNDLCNEFKGNWYLTIAAYNCGQYRIESAIRHTGSRNFWSLPLPQETKYYVPKLLALAAIIKNPQKYHVELPHVDNQPYFTAIKVKKNVTLTTVAKSTGINPKTLKILNPDYKQVVVPAGKDGSTILVPVNKANEVKTQLAQTKALATPV